MTDTARRNVGFALLLLALAAGLAAAFLAGATFERRAPRPEEGAGGSEARALAEEVRRLAAAITALEARLERAPAGAPAAPEASPRERADGAASRAADDRELRALLVSLLAATRAGGAPAAALPAGAHAAPALGREQLAAVLGRFVAAGDRAVTQEHLFLPPAEVLARYGKPTRVFQGSNGTHWEYEFPNETGELTQSFSFVFVDGLVANVDF